jgi:hypothetical protein
MSGRSKVPAVSLPLLLLQSLLLNYVLLGLVDWTLFDSKSENCEIMALKSTKASSMSGTIALPWSPLMAALESNRTKSEPIAHRPPSPLVVACERGSTSSSISLDDCHHM